MPPAGDAATSRPLLLFEIDEGFSTSLLTELRNDPAELERRLSKIEEALAELAAVYPVAVLVYPTHMLRPPDAQGLPAGLEAVDPSLLRMLDFFGRSRHGITVYLELYSSGIATNQSGELGKLHAPRLHRADAKDAGRSGLSLDMETLAALRQRYPAVLAGVRFHEVYGSDIVHQVAAPRGFRLDPEVMRATFELCRQTGLRLVWSDSNWLSKTPPNAKEPNYICTGDQRPYILAEPFASLQAEARRKLGRNVCFNWANNNYHFAVNLDYLDVKMQPSGRPVVYPLADWFKFDLPVNHFPMKDWHESRWGMSVQSWFWHELTYGQNNQYYMLGENNCPVEVLAAYCLKGLKEGASVLQFEPPWYFFNMAALYDPKYAGAYEDQPDCSERLALRRLKRVLLDPANPNNPPADLAAWFDRDQVRYIENDVTAPPRNYTQTTLALLPASGAPAASAPVVFDRYNARPDWLRQDEDRFSARLLAEPRTGAGRVELNGDGIDEFYLLQPAVAGADEADVKLAFFDQNSGRLTIDTQAVVLNKDHRLVALTAANVVQRVIGNSDPDELLVVTRDARGKPTLTIYEVSWVADNKLAQRYTPLDAAQTQAALAGLIAPPPGPGARLTALYGLRTEAVLHKNLTRALDRVVARYSVGGGKSDQLLTMPVGKGAACAVATGDLLVAADIDLDRRDELVCLRPGTAGAAARWTAFAQGEAGLTTATLALPTVPVSGSTPGVALGLHKRILLNAR